jgi:hypothetical protein
MKFYMVTVSVVVKLVEPTPERAAEAMIKELLHQIAIGKVRDIEIVERDE